MTPDSKRYEVNVGGQVIIFESGDLAGQANGTVTARLGDTLVFAAATMNREPRPGINFFPLTIDYEERMYAGGRIPGSFFRREGRPTEEAILTARLTDRPLRPLFPKDFRNDVQVVLYSLSADGENPIDILAINAASAAVTISDIPWDGPIAAVRVGRVNDEFVINPTYNQMEDSDLDLRLAGTRDAILMVECSAEELSEDVMIAALELGHQALVPIIDLQNRMAKEIGKTKIDDYQRFAVSEDIEAQVYQRVNTQLIEIFDRSPNKAEMDDAVRALKVELQAEYDEEDEALIEDVKTAFETALKKVVRQRILESGMRPDGRQTGEIRPIWCKVNFSPRAHGSGLFTRGETQVLTLATLGTPRDAQSLDNLTPFEEKRYIHHYNFPPFSVGEARFMRGASRREVGHGALAERALLPVIPEELDFPYTLRLVSEVLSSNGSTSMASVCGSTLALMDTGVPISSPVAGIAMGLIKENDRYAILSDIQGLEDYLGDMDFKVAGTNKGITALQMDIKIKGITPSLMAEALKQAHDGRQHILGEMLTAISEPRPELKPHVPRITVLKIPVEKIGAIIGPGGKTIRSIQEETDTKIDILEDGSVYIASTDGEGDRAARERINILIEEAEVGRIYTGKVVRITDFGAFVEILPGTDGLVHISQLDSERVERVEDVVESGDEITVMVTDINDDGKIRLSRQAVLEGWSPEEAREKDRGGNRKSGGRPRGRSRSGGQRSGGQRSGGQRSADRRRKDDRNRR